MFGLYDKEGSHAFFEQGASASGSLVCAQPDFHRNPHGAAVLYYGDRHDNGTGGAEYAGSTVVAAYTAACKVEQLVTQVFAAMGMTMATYCGQNRGINDLDRIRKGSRIAFWMSAIYGVIIYAVVVLALPLIIQLFVTGDSSEVLGYARTYIIICGAFFIPLGMIFIYRNVMQSCGFALMPMMGGVVELVSRAALAIVAAELLSYEGVCAANASAWCLGAYSFISLTVLP